MKKYFNTRKLTSKERYIFYILGGITINSMVAILLILSFQNPNSSSIYRTLVFILSIPLNYLFLTTSFKKFTKSMELTIETANNISEGNLVVILPTDSEKGLAGELLLSLNVMSKHLTFSFKQMRKITNSINANGELYVSESEKLSLDASYLAATVEEISSAIEEMSGNIQSNTDHANKTYTLTKEALNGVNRGNESTQKVREAMSLIAQKISVIQEIAAQTNILALNASIEASRAGEAGRGFSVVATEIKKLAEKSRINSTEIDKLTRKSLLISERAGIDLEKLVPKISKTVELVNEITNSSHEQQIGATQIHQAINQLNSVTQKNAAAAELLQSRSKSLLDDVDLLKGIIKDYKVH